MRIKRQRGGQPGNQNARKHGLYSARLSLEQVCEIANILNAGGCNPELIALRIKLVSALQSASENRRVFMEASKILYKWYLSGNDLGKQARACFRGFIRGMLKALQEDRSVLTERIVAKPPGAPQELTERIDSKNSSFSAVQLQENKILKNEFLQNESHIKRLRSYIPCGRTSAP